jgi:dinuclear metal center YbgI/SA1388 family protein
MAKLKEVIKYLDNYLKINEIEDRSWNGLQVEGREDVRKIVFCVTAGADVFEKAKKEKPGLIIVHHGVFWKGSNPSIKGWQKKRIKSLLDDNISLYVCHLPLDRHPLVGNNAQLFKMLGIKIKEPMSERNGRNIGWIGEIKGISLNKIVNCIEQKLKTKCLVLNHGKEQIKRVGIVSGGAPYDVFEAIEKEVDLYITGDPADIREAVKDAKINVIFAGHYATETVGVKALSLVLRKKFKIETVFVDMPTGL